MHHYHHVQNQLKSSIYSWYIADFRVPWSKRTHPFLTMRSQKLWKYLLTFLNLFQHAKNRFILSIRIWDTVHFRVQWLECWHTFLTMQTQTFFNQLLIFMNSYRHASNQAFSQFCSRDLVDSKIVPSDWQEHFS